MSFRVVEEWYYILEEGGRDELGGGCWTVSECFVLYVSVIEIYKNEKGLLVTFFYIIIARVIVRLLFIIIITDFVITCSLPIFYIFIIVFVMAPAGGVDAAASPGNSAMPKNCPCNMEVSGRSIAWISCRNENCDLIWHATCAGFSKSTKQSTIKAIGEWVCPKCVMQNLFPENKVTNEDLLTKFASKIDEMKEELKTEIKSGKRKVNENVKSYSDLVKENIRFRF